MVNKGQELKTTVDKVELCNMMRNPGERFNVIESYPEKERN